MPQSVCLIVSDNYELLDSLSQLAEEMGLKSSKGGDAVSIQLFDAELINYADFLLMTDQEGAVEDYLADRSLNSSLRSSLKNMRIYLVSHSNLDFVRKILVQKHDELVRMNCWIDDDHGNVSKLDAFLEH